MKSKAHIRGTVKSQSALEFMSIVAVGLLLIVLSASFGYDYILSYFDSINAVNADHVVDNVAAAVNLVYSQGIGAQTKVAVTIPEKMVLNRTYIDNNEINLRFASAGKYKDVFKNAAVDVVGSIPTTQGKVLLFVKMEASRAVIFVNSYVSYMTVELYNDSARTNEDYTFSTGETVYYTVSLYDFDGSAIDANFTVNVYKPDMAGASTVSAISSSGQYNGSFALGAGDDGYWLVSAVYSDIKIIGTSLFNKI